MSNRTEISFEVTFDEASLIIQAAKRAVVAAKDAGVNYQFLDAEMDLTATHANGCPLDLRKLLKFKDRDFNHDVFGIRRHINRKTGQLENCFLPRCARAEKVIA